MAKGDDLEERLFDLAVRIIRVVESLPQTIAGQHVSDQLLRCGTSPAANYGEARGSESERDFVYKLRIALKELNEAGICLKIVVHNEMLPPERLEAVLDENEQLCRIIGASIQTARRSAKR